MKTEIYNTLDELLSELDKREIDIIKKRFGIENPRMSLEKIGKEYGITRERVRQIENKALNKMSKKSSTLQYFEKRIYPEIHDILGNLKVKREFYIFKKLKDLYDIDENIENILRLFFVIYENFHYEVETKIFFSYLSTIKEVLIKSKLILEHINSRLIKLSKPLKEENLFDIIRDEIKTHLKITPDIEDIIEFIKISKIIKKNPLNEIGYINHERIAPSSLSDKIKIIFELEKRPLHFIEIYEKLKELSQIEDELLHSAWKKTYDYRSIHNALIYNPEFVKYGRGKYALKEWGYAEGHIIDLIKKIVEEEKEIEIEKLYEIVRRHKEISPNTFKIYLYKNFKVNKNIVSLKND